MKPLATLVLAALLAAPILAQISPERLSETPGQQFARYHASIELGNARQAPAPSHVNGSVASIILAEPYSETFQELDQFGGYTNEVHTRTFNAAGRVVESMVQFTASNGASLDRETSSYDEEGRLVRVEREYDSAGTWTPGSFVTFEYVAQDSIAASLYLYQGSQSVLAFDYAIKLLPDAPAWPELYYTTSPSNIVLREVYGFLGQPVSIQQYVSDAVDGFAETRLMEYQVEGDKMSITESLNEGSGFDVTSRIEYERSNGNLDVLLYRASSAGVLPDDPTHTGVKAFTYDDMDRPATQMSTLTGSDGVEVLTSQGTFAFETATDNEEDLPKTGPVSLDIFPNPIHGTGTIRFETDRPSARVIVTDLMGRVVEARDGLVDGSYALDASQYAPGTYFVAVETDLNRLVRSVVVR